MQTKLLHKQAIIHYVTPYGCCLTMCGSHSKFGNWNPLLALRGNCKKDSFWYIDTEIPIDSPSFEYKFVVCKEDENQVPIEVLRWEEGKNRKIDFSELKVHNGKHKQKDFWGYPTITIQDELQLMAGPTNELLADNSILVKGYVIDSQNAPVSFANVSIEGASSNAVSNKSGFFEIEIPQELFPTIINSNEEFILNVKDAIHTPNQITLNRKFVEKELIVITLLPLQSLEIASDKPLEKTTFTDNGEIKISMPANSYLDESGKPYNGEVKIKIGHLDADDPSQLSAFPSFKGKTLSSECSP